jgi:hypothetical protein
MFEVGGPRIEEQEQDHAKKKLEFAIIPIIQGSERIEVKFPHSQSLSHFFQIL